mmetsp:Transcript_25554/g.54550  ORF Transcript_25554/g.54550 Transcript_25554/m.54550 type:complete len:385 (+) Transcript_25554:84-1238(+)
MKLCRSRAVRRRSNSNNDGCGNNNRSKRQGLLIDIDVAKGIVQRACVAAAASADACAFDGHPFESTSRAFLATNVDGETKDALCSCPAETEFAAFVSSTIAEAVASMVAGVKNPQKLSPHSRKRRRRQYPLENKVKGLEYAESLHTMCSLFPMVLTTVESPTRAPIVAAIPASTIGVEGAEALGVESAETYHPDASESNNSSHHSDYDSLLPPVGGAAATITTEATVTNETVKDSNSNEATVAMIPRVTPEITSVVLRTVASVPPPPQIPMPSNAETNTTSIVTLEREPPKPSDSNMSLPHDDNFGDTADPVDNDDDIDYDRPLLGVVSDERSGSCSSNCNDMNDDNDTIIRLMRIGSIVRQKTPPPTPNTKSFIGKRKSNFYF